MSINFYLMRWPPWCGPWGQLARVAGIKTYVFNSIIPFIFSLNSLFSPLSSGEWREMKSSAATTVPVSRTLRRVLSINKRQLTMSESRKTQFRAKTCLNRFIHFLCWIVKVSKIRLRNFIHKIIKHSNKHLYLMRCVGRRGVAREGSWRESRA